MCIHPSSLDSIPPSNLSPIQTVSRQNLLSNPLYCSLLHSLLVTLLYNLNDLLHYSISKVGSHRSNLLLSLHSPHQINRLSTHQSNPCQRLPAIVIHSPVVFRHCFPVNSLLRNLLNSLRLIYQQLNQIAVLPSNRLSSPQLLHLKYRLKIHFRHRSSHRHTNLHSNHPVTLLLLLCPVCKEVVSLQRFRQYLPRFTSRSNCRLRLIPTLLSQTFSSPLPSLLDRLLW